MKKMINVFVSALAFASFNPSAIAEVRQDNQA
jgi:hypothetical protein